MTTGDRLEKCLKQRGPWVVRVVENGSGTFITLRSDNVKAVVRPHQTKGLTEEANVAAYLTLSLG